MPRDLTGTGDTTVVPLPMDFEISLLDLNVALNVTPDAELDVRVVANADLYEPDTVALIADAFNAALEAFATTPDLALSGLELLAPAAMEKLLAPATTTVVQRSQPVTGGSVETEQALIAPGIVDNRAICCRPQKKKQKKKKNELLLVAAGSCADANTASTAAVIRGHRAIGWLTRLGLPARLVDATRVVFTVVRWPDDRDRTTNTAFWYASRATGIVALLLLTAVLDSASGQPAGPGGPAAQVRRDRPPPQPVAAVGGVHRRARRRSGRHLRAHPAGVRGGAVRLRLRAAVAGPGRDLTGPDGRDDRDQPAPRPHEPVVWRAVHRPPTRAGRSRSRTASARVWTCSRAWMLGLPSPAR